jgi:hypothetical protein
MEQKLELAIYAFRLMPNDFKSIMAERPLNRGKSTLT